MADRASPFADDIAKVTATQRRDFVDQPREEALKLAQASDSLVSDLTVGQFRNYEQLEVRVRAAGNDRVFSATNGSFDVVEVSWSTRFAESGFPEQDFQITPSFAGIVPLAPKTRSREILRYTRVAPAATFPNATFNFSIGDSKAKHDLDYLYALPLSGDPLVEQGFNGSKTHNNELNRFAVDFEAAMGTNVAAARAGVVVSLDGRNPDNPRGKNTVTSDTGDKIEGNYVLIRHEDFTYGLYLHLKQNGVKAALGKTVKEGELIGLSGNSGRTSGPHLHFAILISSDLKFGSVEFKFNKQGKGVTPQEGKHASEWSVDAPLPGLKDEPLIKDDL